MTTTRATTATGPQLITRAVALNLLRQLYSQLPAIACKGLCDDSCTAIAASQLERDVLAERGITLPDTSPLVVIQRYRETGEITTCTALAGGRCTVHEVRPFICRAFGAVSHPDATGPERFEQAMMCDHGCEPEFTIDVPTFMRLMCEIEALSRTATGIARAPIPGDSPALLAWFRGERDAGVRVGNCNINERWEEGAWRRADRARKRKRKGKRRGGG